ncbi:MAG: protein kinase [Planctomycetes bacterium]|nr:protein kinase [Planctomycetota bacterium]
MSDVSLNLGQFKVVGSLGRSHYATVYEAQDTKSGSRVAVKVLELAGTHREVAQAMFRKEIGALSGLEHPAVVRLVGHFEEQNPERLGIVLELVPGGRTLEHLILDVAAGREIKRSLRWRLEQLSALLDGLECAHKRNVIHRDVKPTNVLLDRDVDSLKLADFGIARLLENYGRGETALTLREFYTRPFAAPEQVLQGDASFAADLHAFGLLTACLLAWRVPAPTFKREEMIDFLAPLKAEIPDPEAYHKIEQLLVDLLHPDPSARPRAVEVQRVLRELLERTADRPVFYARLTRSAEENARKHGCPSVADILRDLNDGLRGKYEVAVDKQTGAESFSIKCFGRGLWAHLRPESGDPERLVVTNVGRNPSSIHASQRERALSVPFTLQFGEGPAGELISALFEKFEAERRAEDVRRRKESLFEVARFILAKQRESLLQFRIRYEIDDAPPEPGSDSSAFVDAHPGFQNVRVVEVLPTDELADVPEDLDDTWTADLDQRSPLLLDGQRVGTFHSYNQESRVLAIRIQKRARLARRGDLVCKDVALDAALNRQETALDHFFKDECVNPNLGELLLYPESNRLADMLPRRLVQKLEPESAMLSLVERVLAAKDFFLVQGPPGTGKTTVIAEVMAQILMQDPDARVLLTSQANEAVNNALDALRVVAKSAGKDWRLHRDVKPERRNHDDADGVEASFAEWVKRTREKSRAALVAFVAQDEERAAIVRDALKKWDERLDVNEDVRVDYAESVQVFGVTCLRVPTLWRMLRDVQFDWVIVDEAAKATAAEVLVSLVVGKRFVLVGDHKQLPPFLDTQTEKELKASGIDVGRARKSLFEELFEKISPDNRQTLRRQFRMHRSIGSFVGNLFYAEFGGLETGVDDSERTLALSRFDKAHRVNWVDVRGRARKEQNGTSWWNQEELDAVHRLLREFENELRQKNVTYSVGVISPYRAQIERLRRKISRAAQTWSALKIRIDTVDAFQGKQDDIIVYSLVREGEQESRFVSDPRRLNVAFSRSKRLLVIVGDAEGARRSAGLSEIVRAIPPENLEAWRAGR